MLQRFTRREDRGDIFEDKWIVSEKIEAILRAIAGRGSLRFAELFESAASRSEVICTFLALLELIRLRQLVCSQPEAFAEIEIRLAAPPAGTPVPPISPRSLIVSANTNVRLEFAGIKAFKSTIGPPFSHKKARELPGVASIREEPKTCPVELMA